MLLIGDFSSGYASSHRHVCVLCWVCSISSSLSPSPICLSLLSICSPFSPKCSPLANSFASNLRLTLLLRLSSTPFQAVPQLLALVAE
jgi:hypothetical protein